LTSDFGGYNYSGATDGSTDFGRIRASWEERRCHGSKIRGFSTWLFALGFVELFLSRRFRGCNTLQDPCRSYCLRLWLPQHRVQCVLSIQHCQFSKYFEAALLVQAQSSCGAFKIDVLSSFVCELADLLQQPLRNTVTLIVWVDCH